LKLLSLKCNGNLNNDKENVNEKLNLQAAEAVDERNMKK